MNSRLCFGRTRRADNINSFAAKPTTTVAAARKKFHWQDESCIRWFGSGFCLRFDLTYFRWVCERPGRFGIVSATRHAIVAFTNDKLWISDLGDGGGHAKPIRKWFEAICHAVHGRNELSREFFAKNQQSPRPLAGRSPRRFSESAGNRRKWKSGPVGRERNSTAGRTISISVRAPATRLTPLMIQFSHSKKAHSETFRKKVWNLLLQSVETSVKRTIWNDNCWMHFCRSNSSSRSCKNVSSIASKISASM